MADVRECVVVYGTEWCGLTRALRTRLEALGVAYRYHDLERDSEAEAAVTALNGGKRKFPSVVVGGEAMKNPPFEALEAALARHNRLLES